MITVACCHWGDWPEYGWARTYISRLRNMVARHLSRAHRFVCFAEDPAVVPADIETRPLRPVTWRGNLPKDYVFSPDAGLSGRVMVFDLDNVIVGSLDDMAAYDGPLCVKGQWPAWQRGEHVPDGDMISFDPDGRPARKLHETLLRTVKANGSTWRGRERAFIADTVSADIWQDVCPGQIASYKHDCADAGVPPANARVITFHGRPRQHEVHERWVRAAWR